MGARALFLFLPMIALAQNQDAGAGQAPAGVDQALRARVNEFFQDFVDGKFLPAMDLVAEDTKEEYFAAGKTPLKEYKIRNIKFSDNFTKASVDLDVKRVWTIQAQQNVVEVPMNTTWEIEKGKWVWYHHAVDNAWVTPMGPSDVQLIQRNSEGAITGMPQKITQDSIAAAAKKILGGQPTGVDRPEVTFSPDKASTEKVTFHNGAQGSIHLDLFPPPVRGLTVKLSKAELNFGEDASLEVAYDPSARKDGDPPLPQSVAVFMVLVPFNQDYRLIVNFSAPKK